MAVHALLLLAFLFLSTAVQVLILSVQSCCLCRDLSRAGVSWLALIVGSFYRDTCSGPLLSLCCPPSLCLLLVPVAEVAEPDTCQLMQGSAALWCVSRNGLQCQWLRSKHSALLTAQGGRQEFTSGHRASTYTRIFSYVSLVVHCIQEYFLPKYYCTHGA